MMASPSITVTSQEYHLSHQSRLGKNRYRQYAKNTPTSPTKRSSSWLDQTPRTSACWPKYTGGLSPPGQLGTSYRVTWVSTQWYSGVSLKPWPKVFDVAKLITPGRKSYSKRPSTTFKEQVSPEITSTQNDHSKKHPQGTKKIEEKSTSISHAKMGQGELQNGSSGWTEGRWQGT